MKRLAFVLILLLSSLFLLPAPVGAKNSHSSGEHGWEHKKNHDEREDRGGWDDKQEKHSSRHSGSESHAELILNFDDHRRDVTRSYLRDHYRPNCPPGLAKKHNGCLPPGLAKKYHVGRRLPPGYGEPPHDLIELLGPPPMGTFYAMVDSNVLLVSEATKKILDAVTLLSAVK